ncbi:RNA recognition motif isoform A [Micractinium conductrix]|nr:RNA recognition motif isoform A [Micractinium conductrix]|eukprot:PSC71085.1 RNA recognition motif isoform A [Micractinium conductrix]
MVRSTAAALAAEEEQICPLCINELDETEKAWLPCSCGYQLCLFCYDRLKTEFSNQCPNCRVEYDSDFQAGLRRRQERVAQLQHEAAEQREATAKAAAAVAERLAVKHAAPPPPPPRVARSPRSPRSPRRELHIEQEQLWPSLAAATQAAAPQHLQQQHQPAARQQPPSPLAGGGRRQQGSPPAAPQAPAPPPRLAPILQAPLEAEASSSSSSADTAATTPQSPVSSVVAFRAAPAAVAPLLCGTGRPLELALAAQAAHAAAAMQGRCAVVLPRAGGLGADPDPEGASLAASLQEAVRSGSLSVKQAAASLASYLRQRQHAAGAAALGCAAAAASVSGLQQPSHVAGVVPFGLLGTGQLVSEHSLLPCDSGISSATSASLSHWAPGGASPCTSQPLPVLQPLPTRFDGSAAPSMSWQQQQQQQQQQDHVVGSPVRNNDKLPLFLRRGSLRQAGAGCSGGSGSPSGSAGSGSSSSAGSGSFPGFPSRPSSPTQELKRMIAPPPGFGPLGNNGIAALPRFR